MKRFLNILKNIWVLPIVIILFPIIIVFVIINIIKAFRPRKELKFLENEGFKFLKQRKPYALKWVLDNICIMIKNNKYSISLDYNSLTPNYVEMCESNFGTEGERKKLKDIMLSYENAHPRDKMEGYPDVNTLHIQFIKNNLSQIKFATLSQATMQQIV